MDRITQILREELTKYEVNNMISDKLKEKEFENKVKDIVTDVMEKFFRMMYNKRGFWKGDIK